MRYKAVKGSQSDHCCFEATVVDTTKPDGTGLFEPLCECFSAADADAICAALNAKEALQTVECGGCAPHIITN